jgi:hypothetical protein
MKHIRLHFKGFRDDLLAFSINPVLLNIHSTGTLPAVIEQNTFAMTERVGKSPPCSLQKSNAGKEEHFWTYRRTSASKSEVNLLNVMIPAQKRIVSIHQFLVIVA